MKTTKSMPGGFDELLAAKHLLTALGYDTRKEEKQITSKVLGKHKLRRLKLEPLAREILKHPGFELFFLDIVSLVKPFARMVQEVYQFLSSYATTTHHRASLFRISDAGARSAFNFDLSSFPRELLRVIVETLHFRSVIRFQGGTTDELRDESGWWHQSKMGAKWNRISPRWDGDFYDEFHRALSYTWTILGHEEGLYHKQLRDSMEPILDRLRAMTSSLRWEEVITHADESEQTAYSWMNGTSEQLSWTIIEPTHCILDRPHALQYFNTPVQAGRNVPGKVWDCVESDLKYLSLSTDLWERRFIRKDRNDWLSQRFACPLESIHPDDYVRDVSELARRYKDALDDLAPVSEALPVKVVHEKLLEFLKLPFWKDRWFLFELWTLCHTLQLVKEEFPVQLCGLRSISRDDIEWSLPGAAAKAPVALAGAHDEIECWTQWKTYHPETGAGLEPDLRLTTAAPRRRDIFIIENKDRRKPRKGEMQEVLFRYATGTVAKCVCLVNYEQFTESTMTLNSGELDCEFLILSNFKPGNVPESYRQKLLGAIRDEVPPRNRLVDIPHTSVPATCESLGLVPGTRTRISLVWTTGPMDLDLHGWIKRAGHNTHVYYRERGSLSKEPFAELDSDVRRTPGRETITLQVDDWECLDIAVHCYSGGGLRRSDACIQVGNAAGNRVVLCQPDGEDGDWWHVFRISCDKGEVRFQGGRIVNSPPDF